MNDDDKVQVNCRLGVLRLYKGVAKVHGITFTHEDDYLDMAMGVAEAKARGFLERFRTEEEK